MFDRINGDVKRYKTKIFKFASAHFEPSVVAELTKALAKPDAEIKNEACQYQIDKNGNYLDKNNNYIIGVYAINQEDLPLVRDLKALFNMLTAVEEMTARHSLRALSVFSLPHNLLMFRKNYKVYMSTSSVLSHYLHDIKDTMLAKIPVLSVSLKVNLLRLYGFCTTENLSNAAKFIIDNIVLLEQYKEQYKQSKLQEQKQTDEKKTEIEEAKEAVNKGFFIKWAGYIDFYLEKIYGARHQTLFEKEETAEDAKESNQEPRKIDSYYVEVADENDTVKHIKYLCNGIIGIHKTLVAYSDYKNSSLLSMSIVTSGANLLTDFRRAFVALGNFEYQAIAAENAGPGAAKIKKQLGLLNNRLKDCACIIDQYECENNVSEGALLKYLAPLIQEYQKVTKQLNIAVNYDDLSNSYYSFRMAERGKYLAQIESQLDELEKILRYKNEAISAAAPSLLQAISTYIDRYSDDICMNRKHLQQYRMYLTSLIETKPSAGWRAFFWKQLDGAVHRAGMTLHSEVMSVFKTRQLYLEKQKQLLTGKISIKEREPKQIDPSIVPASAVIAEGSALRNTR